MPGGRSRPRRRDLLHHRHGGGGGPASGGQDLHHRDRMGPRPSAQETLPGSGVRPRRRLYRVPSPLPVYEDERSRRDPALPPRGSLRDPSRSRNRPSGPSRARPDDGGAPGPLIPDRSTPVLASTRIETAQSGTRFQGMARPGGGAGKRGVPGTANEAAIGAFGAPGG